MTVYSLFVFGRTVCSRGGGAEIWVRGPSPSWKGGSGNEMKPGGTDLVSHVLALPHSPTLSPISLTSQRRGSDWVDGVTVGCHALEGQRGGDVTVVGR